MAEVGVATVKNELYLEYRSFVKDIVNCEDFPVKIYREMLQLDNIFKVICKNLMMWCHQWVCWWSVQEIWRPRNLSQLKMKCRNITAPCPQGAWREKFVTVKVYDLAKLIWPWDFYLLYKLYKKLYTLTEIII